MADDNKLSGKVTEDAVPLESPTPPGEGFELIPRPLSARSERPQTSSQSTSMPGYSTQPFVPGVPSVQQSVSLQLEPQQGTRKEGSSHQLVHQPQGHAQNVRGPSQIQHGTVSPGDSQSRSGVSGCQGGEDESTLSDDVLKGISKAIGKGLSGEDQPAQSPSQCPSKSSPLELVPADSMGNSINDGDIEKYRNMFPDDLKVDFYDAMILYEETDSRAVNRFLKRINADVWLNNTERPKVVLYDNILANSGMSSIGQLDRTLDHCTYVFLYVTKRFCDDAWTEFSTQTCLMNAIDNAESRWSVVPIFTEPKRNRTFKIPASIRSLKGIQYWNDDNFYVDCLRKLLEEKLHIRLMKAEDLTWERKKWILKRKGAERRQAKQKQQEEEHVMKVEMEKDRQCQRKIQHNDLLFKQAMQSNPQEKEKPLQIQSHPDLTSYEYEGSTSQNKASDSYIAGLFHQLGQPCFSKKSEPKAGNFDQQGMTELLYMHGQQHSFSMPSYRDRQFYGATGPQPVYQQQQTSGSGALQFYPPQRYTGDWRMQSDVSQLTRTPPTLNTLNPTVPVCEVSQPSQHPAGQQPGACAVNSAQKLQTASGVYGCLPGQSLDGGQPSKQQGSDLVSHSSLQASFEPDRQHADSRNAQKLTAGDGKDTCAQSVKRGGEESPEQKVSISQIEKRDTEQFPHKGDLVEDVPLDFHGYHHQGFSSVNHPRGNYMMGLPNLSEPIRQPTLVAGGPAHASRRAGSEPEERVNEQQGPRLMFRGSAGMGDRFSGHGPVPQSYNYMYQLPYPAHLTRQLHPAYMGHFAPPFPVHFPSGYHGPFPAIYPDPFQPPYPYMPPNFTQASPQVPPSAENGANLQRPGLHQSLGHLPPEAPPPYQQSSPHPPPQHQNESQQASVVHYHYHNRAEENPSRTINISGIENVMFANQVSVGDERMPDAHPHPAPVSLPGPEPRAAPEQLRTEEAAPPRSVNIRKAENVMVANELKVIHKREGAPTAGPYYQPEPHPGPEQGYSFQGPPSLEYQHGEQHDPQSHDHQRSGSLPSNSSQHTLSTQQPNSSPLTSTVLRDDRSRQSSVPSCGVGLAELRSQESQPHDWQSSASSQFSPHDRQSYPAGVGQGQGQALGQWSQEFQDARETGVKRYVTGSSDEEDCLEGQDEHTSRKSRG